MSWPKLSFKFLRSHYFLGFVFVLHDFWYTDLLSSSQPSLLTFRLVAQCLPIYIFNRTLILFPPSSCSYIINTLAFPSLTFCANILNISPSLSRLSSFAFLFIYSQLISTSCENFPTHVCILLLPFPPDRRKRKNGILVTHSLFNFFSLFTFHFFYCFSVHWIVVWTRSKVCRVNLKQNKWWKWALFFFFCLSVCLSLTVVCLARV
jgi:hypothetical protein